MSYTSLMTQIQRLRVIWGGSAVVGGGLNTFYCATLGDPLVAATVTFFDSLKALWPTEQFWTIPGGGDLIEDTTGELAGTWTEGGGTPTTVTGTNTAKGVLGVGARIVWSTGGMTNGRRVKGSTFLTGFTNDRFEGSGAIAAGTVTALQNAANTLRSTCPTLRILSAPTTPGGTDGKSSVITGAIVPDKVSWLRSRRT